MRYSMKKDNNWISDNWIAIDTETGGLDPMQHALLTVAAWSPDVSETWMMRPDGRIESEALRINGLDPSQCAQEGLSRKEAAARLLQLIRGKAIVGQNICFDMSFIARRIFGIKPEDEAARLLGALRLIDTHDIFLSLHPGEPCHLCEIAAYYGIKGEGFHTAIYDAEVTGRVYMAMLKELKDGSQVQ